MSVVDLLTILVLFTAAFSSSAPLAIVSLPTACVLFAKAYRKRCEPVGRKKMITNTDRADQPNLVIREANARAAAER